MMTVLCFRIINEIGDLFKINLAWTDPFASKLFQLMVLPFTFKLFGAYLNYIVDWNRLDQMMDRKEK